MQGIVRFLLISLCAMMVVGCSSFKIKDKRYLEARSVPPLKIPPGISSDAFHNQYPVSSRDYSAQAKEIDLEPPGLNNTGAN